MVVNAARRDARGAYEEERLVQLQPLGSHFWPAATVAVHMIRRRARRAGVRRAAIQSLLSATTAVPLPRRAPQCQRSAAGYALPAANPAARRSPRSRRRPLLSDAPVAPALR